jgi:hypothetical protein
VQRSAALCVLPIGTVAAIFAYAALTIPGGLWTFGPVALFAATLAAWLYRSIISKILIFSITEAGIASKYWSFELLPWQDIRDFEITRVDFNEIGKLPFLDFELHEPEKYASYMSGSKLVTSRPGGVPLSIPLAYVSFNERHLRHLLRARITGVHERSLVYAPQDNADTALTETPYAT